MSDMTAEKEKRHDDYSQDENVERHVRKNRWISVDIGGKPFLRFNWVSSLLASLVLWGFVAAVLIDDENHTNPKLPTEFSRWRRWITVNFSWMYILTQDVWFIFVLWLLFTKYANIKLGRDDDKPEFSDFAWFSMLFSCGIGVGFYYYGVSEPIYHYRQSANLQSIPVTNDDQKAQQAIFQTLFHWGLHGWIPYIVVALTLGVTCHRQGLPMTMRNAFHPLIGDHTRGFAGDLIDALSISCTTFGVCTSLGLGVSQINSVLARLDGSVEVNQKTQTGIIWIITAVATISVLLGLKRGIKSLSLFTFTIGLVLLVLVTVCDNTWFLLNSFVEAVGTYMTWVIQVGFKCGTWTQLNQEFDNGYEYEGKSLLWGKDSLSDKLYEATGIETSSALAIEKYDSGPSWMMDGWTIFYWGWWISWAPFVGMFIARISRGRTVGQLIKGAFVAPVLFGFFYLTVLGSLGIKMQRVAELALGDSSTVDWSKGSGAVDCSAFGYAKGALDTTLAKYAAGLQLQQAGYYPLSCRAGPDHILDVVEPYGSLARPFQALILIAVTLYFITSSDSGSYVDDLISAMGYESPPVLQKIYWCFTEGALASALVYSGGLKMVQAVSIVAGFPYTIALNFMCLALWRALQDEGGDEEYRRKRKGFNTCIFDFLERFNPDTAGASAPVQMERLLCVLKNFIYPFDAILKSKVAMGADYQFAMINAAAITGVLWTFIGLMASTHAGANTHAVAWLFCCIFIFCVANVRRELRNARNILGCALEDYTSVAILFPFALAQMEHEADADDKTA